MKIQTFFVYKYHIKPIIGNNESYKQLQSYSLRLKITIEFIS